MLVRRIARPLLSSIFLFGGLDAVRHPAGKVDQAETVGASRIAASVGLHGAEDLIRANGIAQVLGGLALVTNRVPRLAALGLAASLVPTTFAGHRFWEEQGSARAMQQTQFAKNLSLLGGLLIAAVDTEGKESVRRRVRRRAHDVATAMPVGGTPLSSR